MEEFKICKKKAVANVVCRPSRTGKARKSEPEFCEIELFYAIIFSLPQNFENPPFTGTHLG